MALLFYEIFLFVQFVRFCAEKFLSIFLFPKFPSTINFALKAISVLRNVRSAWRKCSQPKTFIPLNQKELVVIVVWIKICIYVADGRMPLVVSRMWHHLKKICCNLSEANLPTRLLDGTGDDCSFALIVFCNTLVAL